MSQKMFNFIMLCLPAATMVSWVCYLQWQEKPLLVITCVLLGASIGGMGFALMVD